MSQLACGRDGPTPSPTPIPPPPSSITVQGTITDTVTSASVGSFTQTVPSLPAQLTINSPGYVARQTWVHSASPRVDLFPNASFDLGFYRQFARGGLEGRMDPLRVLTQAPAIYLQRAGLSDANVAALEQAARTVVPALTGGRFQVTRWETGEAVRSPSAGWITVELNNTTEPCGYALIGVSAGHVKLSATQRCGNGTYLVDPGVFAHELGHALGFWHVEHADALMKPDVRRPVVVSELERRHAAFAYARQPGNTDIDVDPRSPASFQTCIIID